jgi:hypothetical protein
MSHISLKMKSLIVLFLVFIVVSFKTVAQQRGQYVIMSFEQTHKISQHGTKKYFWIFAKDSIGNYDTMPACLFLEGLSATNVSDCCSGKAMDPFLVFAGTDFRTDSLNVQWSSELTRLIQKNRKEIQTIVKTWNQGQKETIKVYATPVTGVFCFSEFHPIGQDRTGYHGLVSLPFSKFHHDAEFWASSKAKYILTRDFSKIPFSIIAWPN